MLKSQNSNHLLEKFCLFILGHQLGLDGLSQFLLEALHPERVEFQVGHVAVDGGSPSPSGMDKVAFFHAGGAAVVLPPPKVAQAAQGSHWLDPNLNLDEQNTYF